MIAQQKSAPEAKMETFVGYVLLIGVLCSITLLTVGLIWHWIMTGQPQWTYSLSGTNLLEFWAADLRQLQTLELRPRLFVNLGIAVLLITPYLRVLASALYFALVERNLKYTVFTTIVLSVLTYSLFLR